MYYEDILQLLSPHTTFLEIIWFPSFFSKSMRAYILKLNQQIFSSILWLKQIMEKKYNKAD